MLMIFLWSYRFILLYLKIGADKQAFRIFFWPEDTENDAFSCKNRLNLRDLLQWLKNFSFQERRNKTEFRHWKEGKLKIVVMSP